MLGQVRLLLRRRPRRGQRQDERRTRRQRRRARRDDQRRPARASGLHHPDRGLPRIHARQGLRAKSTARWTKRSRRLEQLQGQKLGGADNPLLVSVRSGAKFSMPGMMDTILNLGLNDKSVEGLAKRSNNPRFAYDSYRRLIQMFGNVVLDIPKHAFEEVFDGKKKQKKAKLDTDLDAKALQEVIAEYKKVVQEAHQARLPAGPARAAGDGARRRLPLLAQRPRQALSPHQQHRRHAGHRRQRAGHGLRQPGRDQRHRRGLHAQSRHRREGVLRRVPDERAGRGRGRRHPHAGAHLRAGKDHARGLQPASRHHHAPGEALPRHAGLRVHHPGRPPVHAADAQRQAHRPRRRTRCHRDGGRRPDHQGRSHLPRRAQPALRLPGSQPGREAARVEVLATGLPASPGAAVGQIVFTADEAVETVPTKTESEAHPGARRNHARRHSRHGSGGGHSDLARRHDQPRRGGHARHGQVLRGRRRRCRGGREGARDARQRQGR